MHRKRAQKALGELNLAVWRRRVTFACLPRPCGGCHMCWWGRWKSQHRKIVHLPPYVEKPFNSKVIKGFVPELRSRYVFFVFGDSYVLCIYVMNILCTFHTYPYIWLCNITYKLYLKIKYIIIIIIIIIYSFRVFHISISWWFFTGVWVTASLLKSPGLFSAMLSFG